jgi:hypothetical protein
MIKIFEPFVCFAIFVVNKCSDARVRKGGERAYGRQ